MLKLSVISTETFLLGNENLFSVEISKTILIPNTKKRNKCNVRL